MRAFRTQTNSLRYICGGASVLVNGAVFKTVSETARAGSGRFDSYTPPPINIRYARLWRAVQETIKVDAGTPEACVPTSLPTRSPLDSIAVLPLLSPFSNERSNGRMGNKRPGR